jgi:hypothetical protein
MNYWLMPKTMSYMRFGVSFFDINYVRQYQIIKLYSM